MRKKSSFCYKFSIALNVILAVFLIIWFLVPFLDFNLLAKPLSSCCGVINKFQGEQYLPAWCLESKSIEQEGVQDEELDNEETNVNIINQPIGLANPAAVKCEEDGGNLEKYMTEGGEDALCVFPDNSICNQWAYFRGECQAGKCFKECRAIGTRSEGWYNSCTNELIKWEKCGEESAEPEEPAAATGSIKVSLPTSDAQLSSPFKVEGQAIVKDDKVYIRVKNTAGSVLIEESATAKHQAGTEWADFSIEIKYEFSMTKEGFVEVYSLDQDDKEINLVRIPVKF